MCQIQGFSVFVITLRQTVQFFYYIENWLKNFKMNAEKYFGSKNLYDILQLQSNAEIHDGNKHMNNSKFMILITINFTLQ